MPECDIITKETRWRINITQEIQLVIHNCKLKAKWEYVIAPYGTVRSEREKIYLCTRHHRALIEGKLNHTYITIGIGHRI